MEILTASIDTIVQQIKLDNRSLTNYMSKAFNQVGNNRTRYDSLFMLNYAVDTTQIPKKKLISGFQKENPGWYLPSEIIVLNDSVNDKVDYRLMLSELEMKELKEFVAELSSIEVDYKYRAEAKKKAAKKPCNCPDDDLFLILDTRAKVNDSIPPEYAGTKTLRRNIYNLYLKNVKYCKLCKEKGSVLKNLTIAELQRRITGCPTSDKILNTIRIKDIKDKKIVSDKMLDDLVNYYKSKIEELEKAEKFESNGEVYYWVDRKFLP